MRGLINLVAVICALAVTSSAARAQFGYRSIHGGSCDGSPHRAFGPRGEVLTGGVDKFHYFIFGGYGADPSDPIFHPTSPDPMPRIRLLCQLEPPTGYRDSELKWLSLRHSTSLARPGTATARICSWGVYTPGYHYSCGPSASLTVNGGPGSPAYPALPPIPIGAIAWLELHLVGPGFMTLEYVEAFWWK
ncbi:hypothetical protein [Paracoccus chinensis]|uniref:hypothetical protein n=1 Tax=Paracoccus chinensis TaxID=525640 RepID=UPI001113787F|nr:hypothetical protein [Paracoccus chinensis]